MSSLCCQISGENFVLSELEKQLRDKFGFADSLPKIKPRYRFRELGAFWPHWNLHQRKFHIFNKAYKENEYRILKERICNHMRETKEWGTFFPGYFSPNPYSESLSGFRFKLSDKEQEKLGFRTASRLERKQENYSLAKEIIDELNPETITAVTSDNKHSLTNTIFWDEEYQRPFKISKADIIFSNKIGVPLPSSYYVHRLQDNYQWIPFSGELRQTKCQQCLKNTETSWPELYDGRILCEACYCSKIN